MPPTHNFALLLLDYRLLDLDFHCLERSLLSEDLGKLVSLYAGMSMGYTMPASYIFFATVSAVGLLFLSLNMASASWLAMVFPLAGSKYLFNLDLGWDHLV